MHRSAHFPQYGELLANGILRVPTWVRSRDGKEVAEYEEQYEDIGPHHPMYSLWARHADKSFPDRDLFDGFGNGSLGFVVGISRFIELQFHFSDWENLFQESLDCPPYENCQTWENPKACHERNRAAFQNHLAKYPMLGRIFDMYEDAKYTPDEVSQLLDECQNLKLQVTHPGGVRALRKLIFACNEAISTNESLTLVCD